MIVQPKTLKKGLGTCRQKKRGLDLFRLDFFVLMYQAIQIVLYGIRPNLP